MAFHPYLFFGGNCRQAFTRYQEIFGGELVLLTGADMPEGERLTDADPDLIMHAALAVGDQLLMGSDDPTTDSFGPVQGMMVNYSVDDAAAAERVFRDLSENGRVQMPIGPTSWSACFGMCTDEFGTPWMIGADLADS
jgi:PhnB protein